VLYFPMYVGNVKKTLKRGAGLGFIRLYYVYFILSGCLGAISCL